MNTSFFSFFVFYVLVVLVILLGFFWQDARFYWLSAANLLALVLYFLVSYVLEKKEKSEVQSQTSQEEEKSTQHAHHADTFVKFAYGAHKKSKKRRKLWIWLFVVIFLFVSVMAFRSSLKTVVENILTKKTVSLTGEGEMIGSGFGDILTGDLIEVTGNMIETGLEETGVVVNTDIDNMFLGTEETGTVETIEPTEEMVPEVSASTAIKEKLGITDTKSLTMMDAIVYLMDTHNVVLSSSTGVKFNYVTAKNPYYTYWKTAYDKQLLGKETNPSKLIMCETYITLKGMLEAWDVKYTPSTVKSAYWAEATKRDVINGCVYGKVLKGINL